MFLHINNTVKTLSGHDSNIVLYLQDEIHPGGLLAWTHFKHEPWWTYLKMSHIVVRSRNLPGQPFQCACMDNYVACHICFVLATCPMQEDWTILIWSFQWSKKIKLGSEKAQASNPNDHAQRTIQISIAKIQGPQLWRVASALVRHACGMCCFTIHPLCTLNITPSVPTKTTHFSFSLSKLRWHIFIFVTFSP